MNSFQEIWELVKQELQSSVTEVAYDLWLKPLEFVKFEDDTAYLSIDNFKRKIISNKFMNVLNDAFEGIFGFKVNIEFIVQGETEKKTEEKEKHETPTFEYEYTFDNFIIGPSNRFAHAAALNVANHPGITYNPLFIYGHSGLGKTHLLLAIENEMRKQRPDAEIIYTSGELFTNELIFYIRNHNTNDFHDKYRKCDVLLVDDIQFIAKGETTQEEFFHTFNALKNNGSQIVLTSDRPPKEMMTLEERLRTRFEMGLIADVQPPTIETRMAIVKKKSEDLNIHLDDDVIQFIAENIKKNIRQLEGTVKKIKAYQEVERTEPSIAVAKRAISDIINDNQPLPVTVDNIINEVSRTFDVSAADIRSAKKSASIALARQVAIYIVNQVTGLSLKSIGMEFGNKHHSTIIYSLKECKAKLEKDIGLKSTVDDIIKNINEG